MKTNLISYIAELLLNKDLKKKIAKDTLDDFLLYKRFNSKLRREFSNLFYECIRYYGIFKMDPQNFTVERAQEIVSNTNWSREFAKDISGVDEFISDMIFHNLNSKSQFLKYLKRAPLTIRINSGKTTRDFLKYLYPEFEFTKISPFGLKTYNHINIRQLNEFKKGFFEIQDEASQLVYFLVNPKSGEKILDFCAGSGGKSLALGSTKTGAEIFAYDKNKKRLNMLKQRATTLGEDIKILNKPVGSYNKILIDAPCSGSGSVRRDADVLLRLDEQRLNQLIMTQKTVFEEAFKLTSKGSLIIYATCSFFKEENEDQVEYFLEKYPVKLVPAREFLDKNIVNQLHISEYLKTSPEYDEIDGFFGAVFMVL